MTPIQQSRHFARNLIVGLLAGSAIFPSVAAAQVASTTEDPPFSGQSMIAGNEIIVTARRRDENLQEVPIAITAVSGETLRDLQIDGVEDLETLEPTLSVSASSGRANAPVYSLRGIRPTEAIYGQDPTVAVYFADVVQSPAQGSNLGLYDLENVQILKGPQGTLFGRNTVGGAILLAPRMPDNEFGADLMLGIGNYGLFEAEAGVDFPISNEFAVRVAGRTVHTDGYQTAIDPSPVQGEKFGGEQTWQGRITALWEPAAGIENTTIFSYDDKDTSGRALVIEAANPQNAFLRCYDGPGNPVGGTSGLCGIEAARGLTLPDAFAAVERARGRDVNDVETNIDAKEDVEVFGIVNTTEVDLSDVLTLKSILSYRDVESRSIADLDATAIEGILDLGNQLYTLEHYSGELQFQGSGFGDRLDWVAGLYYYHEEGLSFSPGGFFDQLLALNPIEQTASIDNDTYAVFAQGSFDITPQLSLTLGGRMNWDEKAIVLQTRTANGCSLAVGNPPAVLPDDQCEVALSESFSQPTGTISLDYEITPDILVYGTGRLGYRSGGFNLRADIPAEYEPFDQETVYDVEFGFKSDWSLGAVAMRTNVASYYQWYDDIQRTVAVPNVGGSPGSAVVNAATATVFGIEVQQQIVPTDNLTFQFSYSYVDPEYDEWFDDLNNVDLSDTPFFFTPTHSGNATVIFEESLAGNLGTLKIVGNASYTGDQWINALHTSVIIDQHPDAILPLLKQEAYWLFSASAGVEDLGGSGIDVQAYVRNLTDKDYKVGGVQLYTGATGIISAAYGRPRTFGLQARMSF